MPKTGYPVFKQLYPNGTYNISKQTTVMSFAAGIRWFVHKGSNPVKYNGGGDPDYAKKVQDAQNMMK